ncbi:zinc finger protein 182 [Hypomesus transpacificus]|uniref:zinc finger protein 182 n=1 Tax=Hypomesus transpacificus TaxID=137520 RepID=UPI001F077105|nr:zinc finger protein 182 [Hypomesus transpacificus]
MSPVKGDYQEIRPVSLRLLEENVTSSLYCGTVKGMEDQVLLEAFLVEVYRCRVCQFSTGLKANINAHFLNGHELGASSCTVLSCMKKDEGDSLRMDVGIGVDGEDSEIDQNGSPFNLEDDLHPSSKDGDNHINHMGLDRISFLLPMYDMLPNISPRSCDMGLDSNSDGSLHVAQTCEVSTLFVEEQQDKDEDDKDCMFELEANASVNLSCPMGSVVNDTGNQDEEMAQSAHLMTLGLCRISTAKTLPSQAETLNTKLSSIPVCQKSSTQDDKIPKKPPLQHLLPKQWRSGRGKPLSCIFCNARLTSKRLIKVHQKSPKGDKGFKCLWCRWRVSRWREMELHRRGHGRRRWWESRSRPYSCQICSQTFRSIQSLDAHKQKHSQGCFMCLHCDYSGRSWGRLHKHIVLKHKSIVDNKMDVSDECNSKTYTQREITYLEDLAEGAKSEKSSHLRKTKMKLTRGKKNAEGEEKNMQRKEKQSTKSKEFCCALCDRTFSTKLTMRRHMGIHQGYKPFECPHCQYSTRLKASLVQHLRVHTGEKPYKCPQCPYASIDSSSLLRHSRTHTQEKPYHCQYCPYSSIQKKSLDLHARRHHTGQSFPCHLCQYSSPDRQLLVRHLRKYHTTEQPPSTGTAVT